MTDTVVSPPCPFCGCTIIRRTWNAQKGYYEWGCGSWKRGTVPWQAPGCRVNELEAALEAADQRISAQHALINRTISTNELLRKRIAEFD